jgi:hypothetical protein
MGIECGLVCSAVPSARDVPEMIIAVDLIPGTESIDKDRFTYPTFAHRCPPLRLCVSPVYPGA